jgi:hypothetical protein
MGQAWDEIEPEAEAITEASGSELIGLDAETMAAFDARGEIAVERWVEEVSGQGIDGAALVEAARAAVAKHTPAR